MKNLLQLFTLGLFMVTLSSCDVGAGAYAGTRPGYGHPNPGYYHNNSYSRGYSNPRYYGSSHPTYNHYRPAPRPSGVNARVGTRGLPLNVNSSTRLGLF